MAEQTPIEAILFDLGDTLIQFGQVDHELMFRRAVRQTYRMWARHQPAMPDLRRYYLHQWFAVRWGYLKSVLRNREVDAIRLMRRACRKLSLNAPDEFFVELTWAWYEPLARIATLEPGTYRTLAELKTRGFQLGIVSNTFVPGYVLDRHLRNVGLLSFFPHRIYSYDVTYRKPDARIFRIALDRMGISAPSAVFVGDRFRTDIVGAQRVGMRGILKRSWRGGDEAGRSVRSLGESAMVIDRLTELPGLLATMGNQRARCA